MRGRPIQLHHVDGDPTNSVESNLAALCLDCHDLTQTKGGFARRLSPAQVVRYRDEWVRRVQYRRDEADRLFISVSANAETASPVHPRPSVTRPEVPPRDGLVARLTTLPILLSAAYAAARPRWDSGVTSEMMGGSYQVVEVLELILVGLARYYPDQHFDVNDPREYFSELIASRFRWHRYHNSTEGSGWSGTIVGPLAAGDVIADMQTMVEDMVMSLTILGAGPDDQFDFEQWKAAWRKAQAE
jgi:hypothetical protein